VGDRRGKSAAIAGQDPKSVDHRLMKKNKGKFFLLQRDVCGKIDRGKKKTKKQKLKIGKNVNENHEWVTHIGGGKGDRQAKGSQGLKKPVKTSRRSGKEDHLVKKMKKNKKGSKEWTAQTEAGGFGVT